LLSVWASTPDPAGEAYSAPAHPSWIGGLLLLREEQKKEERKGGKKER